jgi:hypothetical protein
LEQSLDIFSENQEEVFATEPIAVFTLFVEEVCRSIPKAWFLSFGGIVGSLGEHLLVFKDLIDAVLSIDIVKTKW